MDTIRLPFDQWTFFATVGTVLIAVSVLVAGCSDDPILGPDDGAPDDSGGSYSVIKRLGPSPSAQDADTSHTQAPSNPERF